MNSTSIVACEIWAWDLQVPRIKLPEYFTTLNSMQGSTTNCEKLSAMILNMIILQPKYVDFVPVGVISLGSPKPHKVFQ